MTHEMLWSEMVILQMKVNEAEPRTKFDPTTLLFGYETKNTGQTHQSSEYE